MKWAADGEKKHDKRRQLLTEKGQIGLKKLAQRKREMETAYKIRLAQQVKILRDRRRAWTMMKPAKKCLR